MGVNVDENEVFDVVVVFDYFDGYMMYDVFYLGVVEKV